MSARMQVPLSQVRHSNVAVSRYTKNGVRLEIACYKNKVLSYRSGLETRMDEVLQVDRVFTNVGRGSYASAADILKALGPGHTEATALKFVLDHGDLQVAQHERTSEVDEVMKDVITIISQKCVHTATKRPFPAHVIEQALKTMGAAVKPDQPAKKQALHLIQKLVDSNILPIQRANMKLRVTISAVVASEAEDSSSHQVASTAAKVQEWFTANGAEIVHDVITTSSGVVVGGEATPAAATSSSSGTTASFAVLLPPHQFRDAEAFVKTIDGCALNVVETSVAETGEGAASDLQVALQQVQAQPATTPGKPNAGATTAAQKGGNAGKKLTVVAADGSSEGDSKEDHGKKARKAQGPSKGQQQASAGVITAASDDDDDDDDKKKKNKKKAKKPQAPQQPVPKQPAKKPAEEEGSDDDVVSERKKKNHKVVAAVVANQDDEDDFDYGEEDE